MSFEDICPRCGESGHKKYTYNGMELFACPKCDPNEPYVYQLANRDVVKVKTPDNASFQVFPEQQAQEWWKRYQRKKGHLSEAHAHKAGAVAGFLAGHAAGKQDAERRIWADIEEYSHRSGGFEPMMSWSETKRIIFGEKP